KAAELAKMHDHTVASIIHISDVHRHAWLAVFQGLSLAFLELFFSNNAFFSQLIKFFNFFKIHTGLLVSGDGRGAGSAAGNRSATRSGRPCRPVPKCRPAGEAKPAGRALINL